MLFRSEVMGCVVEETLHHLARGVRLADGVTAPAQATLAALNTARDTTFVDIVTTEGRKRQVRRMFEAVGHPVARLTRTKIGSITVGKLRPGEWRTLSPEEVDALLATAT